MARPVTAHWLQRWRQPNEDTLDDATTRLLDETGRTLEDFARGQDNVMQLAIQCQSFEAGSLHITAHTAAKEELPTITETDAITHHGHRYDFHFDEDPYRPQDFGRITLYSSDTIVGIDGVSLGDRLAAADDHMRDLLEREEPLSSRRID